MMARSSAVSSDTIASRSVAPDLLTVIAISALAYLAAIALHEHLGHTTTCLVLGSRPTEVGAFYVDCDYRSLSDLSIRLVALAGPLVSLITGYVCLQLLHRMPPHASALTYFVWLLGSISLMSATGYLLFSGMTGIGDFGTSRDGLFYQATPAWLWQIVLTIAGTISYILIILVAVRAIEPQIAGIGRDRIGYARRLALISYFTGAVVYIAIGLLNQRGFVIVVISAATSSLGATAGLLWMMQLLDRKRQVSLAERVIPRRGWWIACGVIATIVYAIVLGPTLRP